VNAAGCTIRGELEPVTRDVLAAVRAAIADAPPR
jgi:hypothetical protein